MSVKPLSLKKYVTEKLLNLIKVQKEPLEKKKFNEIGKNCRKKFRFEEIARKFIKFDRIVGKIH